jgi:hypothetical protein
MIHGLDDGSTHSPYFVLSRAEERQERAEERQERVEERQGRHVMVPSEIRR